MTKPLTKAGPRALALTTMLVLQLALQACGGGADDVAQVPPDRAQAARGPSLALFAPDGRPTAAAGVPPEGWRHRTQAGLYATAEQFAWEALTVEPYTVLVDVDTHPSADAALDKTLADIRWSADSAHAAFYVRAGDPARAVEVADRLSAAGVPRVFLVVASSDTTGVAR